TRVNLHLSIGQSLTDVSVHGSVTQLFTNGAFVREAPAFRSRVRARRRGAAESAQTLALRLDDRADLTGVDRSRLPSEEVSDLLQRHVNYFPELEESAEALRRDARLDGEDLYQA